MAFDATTPYALACLSDSARSVQSLTVLRQQEPAEVRVQNLVDLAQSWEVDMSEDEAERVVAEYDLVLRSQPKAANVLGGAFNGIINISNISNIS
jgi:hypothetical protein